MLQGNNSHRIYEWLSRLSRLTGRTADKDQRDQRGTGRGRNETSLDLLRTERVNVNNLIMKNKIVYRKENETNVDMLRTVHGWVVSTLTSLILVTQ